MENKEKKRERKSGLAFHCHHEVLVEYVWDYDERVDYIKRNKLASEVDLRLRLFQLIPTSKLPDELNKALAEYDKAWAEYDKALAKYNKARAEYDKALNLAMPILKQLHTQLCPDCPWTGKTIFPGDY